MKTASVKELKEHIEDYLHANVDEDIRVTEDGQAVALVHISPVSSPYNNSTSSGVKMPDWSAHLKQLFGNRETDIVNRFIREERRP